MPKETDNPLKFEESLEELHKIVDQMESNQLSLEQSLQLFERGIHLTRHCQQALHNAEQQVQILMEQDGQYQLNEYDNKLDKED